MAVRTRGLHWAAGPTRRCERHRGLDTRTRATFQGGARGLGASSRRKACVQEIDPSPMIRSADTTGRSSAFKTSARQTVPTRLMPSSNRGILDDGFNSKSAIRL